jgi:Mn2+/Fe2+ NRAMP family transporter
MAARGRHSIMWSTMWRMSLVALTRRADIMGPLVNRPVTTAAAVATAGLIIVMNVYLLYLTFQ